MTKKLYLDDIRVPSADDFIVVRSFEEAVKFIEDFGIPSYISFDHDLGCDEKGNIFKSGYDFARYLVECDLDNIATFPTNFTFNIHSANPVGKQNIESLLSSYLRFKKLTKINL